MRRLLAAIVRWAIHPNFSEREAITVLRAALWGAVEACPTCRGWGYLEAPGGRMLCSMCRSWRRALAATRRA
jgi:hypothetical protein